MIGVRRHRLAFSLAVVAAFGVGVAACAGDENVSEEPATTAAEPPEQSAPPPPPPPPKTRVRVIDGDTSKPVRGARVAVAGERARTSGEGVVRVDVPRKRRVAVRVSAPGYTPEAVRLDFRKRLVQKVQLYRPDLQWPMYGVDPARTQVHSRIKIRPPFRIAWKRNLRSLLEFPAVVWNGVAYVSNIDGYLFALSMKNGRTLWRKRVGTLMASSPGLDPKRRLLVTTTMSPGDVKVVSMDTGRIRWRFSTGRAEPSPVIRNGIAYFGAANGNVYALDLDRRRPRWTFRGGAKITGSPTLVGSRLYVGDYSGRVFALNARTGRVIWTGSAGSRVYGTVAVAGGRVFAPSVFSGMSALSARTGKLLWRIPIGAYTYSSPAVFRNRVYFGTYEGLVYCVNARSGRILWTRPAGGRVSGAVQVVAGVVYAASIDNQTTAWHWRTGRQVWSSPFGEYVPISGNGQRLLLHGAKRIWALDPRRRR